MAGIRIPWQGWTVIRKIGEGSYGAVYEIERMIGDMKEKAALKIMSIPKSQDEVESARAYGYDDKSIARRYEEDFNRILKEYQVMMSMKGHSNIVSCEDIYKEQRTKGIGWRVYIRMEYLTPLLTYKQNQLRNTFDESTVRKVAADMCNALVLCEQKHIIHRDIKPENIMVSEYGSFKLGDFGIARTMDHTTTATSIGSKLYMAPEAIKGEQYNQTVDIYSLGMVLYWMCNNYKLPLWPQDRVPDYDTAQQAYNRRIRGDVLPMPVNGSPQLKKFVMKACAYKPGDRYQTAREMLDALQGTETSENCSRSSTNSPSSAFSGQAAKTETSTSEWSTGSDTSTSGQNAGSATLTSVRSSGSATSSSVKTQGNSWQDTEGTMGAAGWEQSFIDSSSGAGSKNKNTDAFVKTLGAYAGKASSNRDGNKTQTQGGEAATVKSSVETAKESKKSDSYSRGKLAVILVGLILNILLLWNVGASIDGMTFEEYISIMIGSRGVVGILLLIISGPVLLLFGLVVVGKIFLYTDLLCAMIWWLSALYEYIKVPEAILEITMWSTWAVAGILEACLLDWASIEQKNEKNNQTIPFQAIRHMYLGQKKRLKNYFRGYADLDIPNICNAGISTDRISAIIGRNPDVPQAYL